MRSPPQPSQDLAAIPALRHIQDAGAQFTDLGTSHGLRAVFARSGQHFQVFYVAPDGQAVVGGVLWVEEIDSDGDGGIDMAIFTGPHAEQRAKQFAEQLRRQSRPN